MNQKQLPFGIFISCLVIFFNITCSKSSSKPLKTPEQILTANSWMIYEDNGSYGTTTIDYKRGRDPLLNTQNLDGDSIRFNIDSTGTQWITGSQNFPITWEFTTQQKNKLSFTLTYPSFSVFYTWDFTVLTQDTLKYIVHYSVNGTNDSETVVRIPSK